MGTIKRGEGTKLMVLADGAGAPPGICMEKASLTEITLLERTLNAVNVTKRWGCRRIPRRQHNRVATHQDGWKLRLQAAVDYRAHELLAAKLPTLGRAL